jgi:ketosteroid isomerase-like protein
VTHSNDTFRMTRRDAVSAAALGGLGLALGAGAAIAADPVPAPAPAPAPVSASTTEQTRAVAQRWFTALTTGDIKTAIATLSPDIEWINYTVIPGYNDDMAWIGTYRGVEAVVKTFEVFGSVVQVLKEELTSLVVDGDQAAGVIYELSKVKKTGVDFEIEFIQWLTVRDDKIIRWKSYTDPSSIIRAIRGR